MPQQSHVKRATKKTEFSNFLSGLANSFPHFGQLTLWHVITKSTYLMNEIALYENMLSQRVTTGIIFFETMISIDNFVFKEKSVLWLFGHSHKFLFLIK